MTGAEIVAAIGAGVYDPAGTALSLTSALEDTLGSAAYASTASFASAAQGATADSALQPGDTAGGDLSGTLPSPTVAKINGVAVTGTPAVGYVPTATGASAATWQAVSGAPPATRPPANSTGAWGAPGMIYYSQQTNWIANGNILHYAPRSWNQNSVITDVAIVVVSGFAATQSRAGLYTADEQWQALSLVADFGTFDHTTSGTKTITGLSVPVSGQTRYVVGFIANGQFRVSAGLGGPILGGIANPLYSGVIHSAPLTYGALPSTAPAATVWPGYAVIDAVAMKWTTA